MSAPKKTAQDERLLREVKAQLIELGFSVDEYADSQEGVDDFPHPMLGLAGTLGDVQLGAWMHRVPRYQGQLDLLAERYLLNLQRMSDAMAGVRRAGRPTHRYWVKVTGEDSRDTSRLASLCAPMGLGHYGLPIGVVGRPYHAAEMAYLVACSNEGDVDVQIGPSTYAVYGGGKQFGVREDRLLLPDGAVAPGECRFELSRFYQTLRYGGDAGADFNRMPMWAAIRRFTTQVQVPDVLMHALSHLRYFYEWRTPWGDVSTWESRKRPRTMKTIGRGGIAQSRVTPVAEKIAMVEMALARKTMLQATPAEIYKILCPVVMTYKEYASRFNNITSSPTSRFRSKTHLLFLEQLNLLLEELHAEKAAEEERGSQDH